MWKDNDSHWCSHEQVLLSMCCIAGRFLEYVINNVCNLAALRSDSIIDEETTYLVPHN